MAREVLELDEARKRSYYELEDVIFERFLNGIEKRLKDGEDAAAWVKRVLEEVLSGEPTSKLSRDILNQERVLKYRSSEEYVSESEKKRKAAVIEELAKKANGNHVRLSTENRHEEPLDPEIVEFLEGPDCDDDWTGCSGGSDSDDEWTECTGCPDREDDGDFDLREAKIASGEMTREEAYAGIGPDDDDDFFPAGELFSPRPPLSSSPDSIDDEDPQYDELMESIRRRKAAGEEHWEKEDVVETEESKGDCTNSEPGASESTVAEATPSKPRAHDVEEDECEDAPAKPSKRGSRDVEDNEVEETPEEEPCPKAPPGGGSKKRLWDPDPEEDQREAEREARNKAQGDDDDDDAPVKPAKRKARSVEDNEAVPVKSKKRRSRAEEDENEEAPAKPLKRKSHAVEDEEDEK